MWYDGKVITVTGGTGSFGKAFIKYVLSVSSPKEIRVYSRDEYKQYLLSREVGDKRLKTFIGDIRDKGRILEVIKGSDLVVHAAALKRVEMGELHASEFVKTNIIGAQNLIEASIEARIPKVIMVSTDKAVEPVSLYGMTKACAEKLFVSANFYPSNTSSKFSVARYGNLINSRGSFLPMIKTFLSQDHSPIPITHKEMTRFWIPLYEAVSFITKIVEIMCGGEIFIPFMKKKNILEMVKEILPENPIEIIGKRPGERIHEKLISEEEAEHTYIYQNFFVIIPSVATIERYPYLLENSKKWDKGPVSTASSFIEDLSHEELLSFLKDLEYERNV